MLVMAKISRKYYKYGLYGLVALVVLGFAWREVLVYRQKAEFGKAEVQLDKLAVDIEKLVGKPDDIKKEKSCGRAHMKSERGPLVCGITVQMFFRHKSAPEATELMNLVSNSLNKQPLKLLGEPVDNFVHKEEYRGDQIIDQHFDPIAGLSCGAQYIYPVLERLDQSFKPLHPENLQIDISCGGPAIAEHYPVKD